MIVECDNCGTGFNLPDETIEPEGSWVRCSNCEHVFQVLPQGSGAEAPEDEGGITLDIGGDVGGAAEDLDDDGFSADLGDFDLTGDDELPDAPAEGGPGKIFKIIFWLFAIIILLAVIFAGGLVAMDRMGMARGIVDQFRDLPGISMLLSKGGGPIGMEDSGKIELGLINTRAYFKTTSDEKRRFVIQGLVENNHKQSRTDVLVRGLLMNKQGKKLREAVVYAGPVFTREQLGSMSLTEIQATLGSSQSPSGGKFKVAPGGAIPFMVVFGNLPADLGEFTAEVVSSKPAGSMK